MPTEIPEKFVKLISQLEGKGKLFGQWNIQSKFSNYLTKKELVT
jgi:hypothetical protein